MGYGWNVCGYGGVGHNYGPDCYRGFGAGRGFALLVVLFILLIIIGACYVPNNGGHHDKKDC